MFASPTLLGLLLLLGNLLSIALAAISSMSYKPKGVNPLLYDPGLDPIMHLDADTFADTVFNPTRDRAFLVEFYKDWFVLLESILSIPLSPSKNIRG